MIHTTPPAVSMKKGLSRDKQPRSYVSTKRGLLDLPNEIQKMILEEYYSSRVLRAAATSMPDGTILVFSEVGPLLVNKQMHEMAKGILQKKGYDTFIFNHHNLSTFRRRACLDVMMGLVPALKFAAEHIKLIKFDYGPHPRYGVLEKRFPNIEKYIVMHEDGEEHGIVRGHGFWMSEDLVAPTKTNSVLTY